MVAWPSLVFSRAKSSCARGAPTRRRRSAERPAIRWSAERPARSDPLAPRWAALRQFRLSRYPLGANAGGGRRGAGRAQGGTGHRQTGGIERSGVSGQRQPCSRGILVREGRADMSDVGPRSDPHSGGQQRDPLAPPVGRRRRFRFSEIRLGANAVAAAAAGGVRQHPGSTTALRGLMASLALPSARPWRAMGMRDRPAGCASCATRLCGALCGIGRPPRGGRRRSFVGNDRAMLAVEAEATAQQRATNTTLAATRRHR